jgi:signal transduction histidine kinase
MKAALVPAAASAERILLLVATRRDAEVTQRLLEGASMSSTVCGSMNELLTEMASGAGALLLTEDMLLADDARRLIAHLQAQDKWSDLPVVVMIRGGTDTVQAAAVLQQMTNVTILERPAPMRSVLSAVEAAVRARRRQFQLREQMEAVRQAELRALALQQEAEHANRLKDEFLATLSHELRTPLNAIAGWAELLQNALDDPDTVAEAAGAIARNVRAQAELIEDLLDVSRIISGKVRLDLRPLRLDGVVESAVETVQPSAQGKKVALVTAIDRKLPPVAGDAARLQQVFWNLLSNAVKFTPAGGQVKVTLKRVNRSAVIQIVDTGEGIDPAFLPRLFERFSQADGSPSRRHGGAGLGLSIVRGLIEMHGGRVRAASEGRGRGAAFEVELPLTASPAGEDARPAPPTAPEEKAAGLPDLTGLRLLIVDDEPDGREVLARLLRRVGAVPAVAGSAEEAHSLAREMAPEVIISDIGMPDTDGYQLIRELRAKKIGAPAIALTAFARPEDARRALAAGYQAHLSKPVDPPKLLALVEQLSRSR